MVYYIDVESNLVKIKNTDKLVPGTYGAGDRLFIRDLGEKIVDGSIGYATENILLMNKENKINNKTGLPFYIPNRKHMTCCSFCSENRCAMILYETGNVKLIISGLSTYNRIIDVAENIINIGCLTIDYNEPNTENFMFYAVDCGGDLVKFTVVHIDTHDYETEYENQGLQWSYDFESNINVESLNFEKGVDKIFASGSDYLFFVAEDNGLYYFKESSIECGFSERNIKKIDGMDDQLIILLENGDIWTGSMNNKYYTKLQSDVPIADIIVLDSLNSVKFLTVDYNNGICLFENNSLVHLSEEYPKAIRFVHNRIINVADNKRFMTTKSA